MFTNIGLDRHIVAFTVNEASRFLNFASGSAVAAYMAPIQGGRCHLQLHQIGFALALRLLIDRFYIGVSKKR